MRRVIGMDIRRTLEKWCSGRSAGERPSEAEIGVAQQLVVLDLSGRAGEHDAAALVC